MEVKFAVGFHGEEDRNFLRKWELGSCFGHPSQTYDTELNYIDSDESLMVSKCCLKPGLYSLFCHNLVKPFGWGKGYLEIQGRRYCDDFVGFKAMRKVIVSGKRTSQRR